MARVDQEIDELFQAPLEEFVARRDELARSLNDRGESDSAKQVKAYRRPTLAAWALNQLPRRHPEEVRALLEAGEALRAAQRKALSGADGDVVRQASAGRRRAVQDLTTRAVELLQGRGGQGAEERIEVALEAASVDSDVGEQLMAGRLSKEPAGGTGFDVVQGFDVLPGGRGKEESPPPADTGRRQLKAAEREAERAEAEARRAAMRAESLENDADKAARRAQEARAEADRLEQGAQAARQRLERVSRRVKE